VLEAAEVAEIGEGSGCLGLAGVALGGCALQVGQGEPLNDGDPFWFSSVVPAASYPVTPPSRCSPPERVSRLFGPGLNV
jgi:hypothetical protein